MKIEHRAEHLTLFMTTRCNLACAYCYCGTKGSEDMPAELAKEAVNLLLESGGSVSFFGGEPLLCLDNILNLSGWLGGMTPAPTLQLTTNGLLLTGEVYRALLDAGIHITLSLDGLEKRHDAYRKDIDGGGSWRRVIENSADWPQMPLVRMTFNPNEAAGIGKEVEALCALGFRRFTVASNQDAAWDEQSLDAYEAECEELSNLFIKSYRENDSVYIDAFDVAILSHTKKLIRRCLPGIKALGVLPNGDIHPCHRVDFHAPQYLMGNVVTGVDAGAAAFWEKELSGRDPACADCALTNRCTFCPLENLRMCGAAAVLPEHKCRMGQIHVRAADRAARTLYGEGNMLFSDRYFHNNDT